MKDRCVVKWAEYLELIKGDLIRYGSGWRGFCTYFFLNIGFRYSFFLRTTAWLKGKLLLFPFFVIARLIHGYMVVKYGIDIPYNTRIGPGLYIGHYGGIVVNQEVIIGRNCNINHGVTIGVAYGGKHPGCPVIGDNIFFGAGSKIFGGITIENDVAVGANCVVAKTVPQSAVVVGVPGRVISYKGSAEYVVNRA